MRDGGRPASYQQGENPVVLVNSGKNNRIVNNYVGHSLSRSRDKSPLDSNRKNKQSSYAQYSYHKNFSFLKKNH